MTLALGGCATTSKTQQGAAAGAVIGGVIGGATRGDSKGVLIGSVVGALVGGVIGNYMDRKEQELRQAFPNEATVERVAENQIQVSFSDSVPFDTASAGLKPEAFPTLSRFAQLVQDNPNTLICITGHTDNAGNHLANQQLSEARAGTVARYLVVNGGLSMDRVVLRGAGEMAPLDNNNTAAGRASNRRVDILILPAGEPVPPVRFTAFEDTEPAGYRKPRQQTMTVKKPDGRGGRQVPVRDVITEEPHEYSPIRSARELMAV
jgi:outer membrane protein OmpA-like peptidoglycan-associated protein